MAAVLHTKTFQELTTDELYDLLKVRSEVFVVEQNCVYQDMDGDDQQSIHLWLTVADKIVALARVSRRYPHEGNLHWKSHHHRTGQRIRQANHAPCHRRCN